MQKKTLLIADDEEMSRMIISQFLKDEYEIMEATDGVEAMEIIESKHIDVLLLDIIMPQMDGLEVLKKIEKMEQTGHMAVLVATSTKEKTERIALEYGADDIVSKPYDPVVIRKRLTNILAVKELNRQYQLQQTADEKALIDDALQKVQTDVEQIGQQIKKRVNLIKANKENIALLNEMLLEIEKQTEKLTKVTL